MIKIIKGEVLVGKKIWRIIWFPTANISLWKYDISDGVYKVNVIFEKKIYFWAASSSKKKWIFEVHIFNFNKNMYWKKIKIILFDKIRENRKFDSEEELKKQIKIDIVTIKNIKDYVLTFGTFDIIHPGHKYFLKKAKRFWDRLVTIVATWKNVVKFKKHAAQNNLDHRMQDVKNLWLSDIVSPWNEDNPLIWIKLYLPKVICLWYDQDSFTQILEDYIKKENLDIHIRRIKPYKEDVYKSSIIKKELVSNK